MDGCRFGVICGPYGLVVMVWKLTINDDEKKYLCIMSVSYSCVVFLFTIEIDFLH